MKIHEYLYIIVSFLLVSILACQQTKPEEKTEKPEHKHIPGQEIIVKTTVAKQTDFNNEFISNGKLGAIKKAGLHFLTGGLLSKINVKNGSFVQKGQTIAQLKNTEQQNNMLTAQAALEKASLEKQSLLLEYAGSTDTASLPATIIQNLAIRSGFNSALVELKKAKYELQKTTLKAPFSGKIANLKLKAHNLINTGDVFCTILDNNNYEAEFYIVENELKFLNNKPVVKITTISNDSVFYKAKISEINPTVNKNGLVNIKAVTKNKNKGLLDGMNIKIIVNYFIPNQIIVPKNALVIRSGKPVVFTYQNGLAKWNYVKISAENSTSYALSEGINKGDTIIVSNNLNLAHDAFVKTESF